MPRIEADLLATDLRIAVVHTRWNHFVVDRLVEGAERAFAQHGGRPEHLTLVAVPGAYEVPLVARRLADGGKHDAVVCLGAVIRGATDHHEHVAGAAASGLARVALDSGVPVAFGLLTTDTIEQAIERAGTKAGNKGAEALLAAVETANLLKRL